MSFLLLSQQCQRSCHPGRSILFWSSWVLRRKDATFQMNLCKPVNPLSPVVLKENYMWCNFLQAECPSCCQPGNQHCQSNEGIGSLDTVALKLQTMFVRLNTCLCFVLTAAYLLVAALSERYVTCFLLISMTSVVLSLIDVLSIPYAYGVDFMPCG